MVMIWYTDVNGQAHGLAYTVNNDKLTIPTLESDANKVDSLGMASWQLCWFSGEEMNHHHVFHHHDRFLQTIDSFC